MQGVAHLTELIQKGIFRTLRDENEFQKVYINGSSIAWNDELEIDPKAFYSEINTGVLQTQLHYAIVHAAD